MSGTTNTPAKTAAAAERAYARETGDGPFLPGKARAAYAKRIGRPSAALASAWDAVYYRRNGETNPLPVSPDAKRATLAAAVKARRNAGGTLARWDTLVASLATALGRPVSRTEVEDLYRAARGTDRDASYTGRGTRVGAPKTRDDASLALAAE